MDGKHYQDYLLYYYAVPALCQIAVHACICLFECCNIKSIAHSFSFFYSFSYFLSQIGPLVGAFLAPILLIITIIIIILVCIVVVMIQHARHKVAQMNETISSKQILLMTISINGVLFLFGLTWLFLILTFSVPGLRETFQILFTIFNSLQGFFVFVFILFTGGYGYWKATTRKEDTDLTTISRQEKCTSDVSQSVSTTEMKKEPLKHKKIQASTDPAIELLDMNTLSSVEHENGQNATGSDHEQSQAGKQTDTKPLKVLVKHYSTKKYRRHQVEEVKVHFYHEDSSSSDEGSLSTAAC